MDRRLLCPARRWVLATCLVLAAIVAPQPSAVVGQSGDPYRAILPLMLKSPPFFVRQYAFSTEKYGRITVTGEFMNVTSHPVYSVTLKTDVYRSDGTLFGSFTSIRESFAFSATLPGQPNPFSIGIGNCFQSNCIGISTAKFSISVISIGSPHQYQPVTVITQTISSCGGGLQEYQLVGKVRNDSPYTLTNVTVVPYIIADYYGQLGNANPNGFVLAPGAAKIYKGTIVLYGLVDPRDFCTAKYNNLIRAAAQGEIAP